MPTLPNPADQLSAIVTSLYQLASNSNVSQADRQSLLVKAHDLRGDLVTLVSAQFTQSTAAYQSVMANLGAVNAALASAQQDINTIIGVVNSVGQLATAIDGLLAEAASIATKV